MRTTGVVIAAASLLLSACAHGGDKAAAPPPEDKTSMGERVDSARKGIGEAAITPFKDVGLVKPEVPQTLGAIKYPYAVTTLGGSCAEVTYQLGALDAVLGVEDYRPKRKKDLGEKGADAAENATVDAAQGAAESVIPFRGWIRRASGADAAARRVAAAVEMGQTRRAFLRGYGAALGCPGVLPPPPEPQAATGTQLVRPPLPK
ncbi:MAG: hypothetical protein KJS97_02580 [Alphaproteobacteria bacterium]|nr:hypothetical protein [Alphaproteobacteria bacterium]